MEERNMQWKKQFLSLVQHTWDYLCVIVGSIAGLVFVYRLWEVNISKIPFSYSYDGLWSLTITKIMNEAPGLGYQMPRLGAPFGYTVYDFTTANVLPRLVMKLGALVTDNFILALNLSYFLGFILIGCVSLFVFKRLHLRRDISVMLSILYSFLPYHFWRGEAHIALAFYATIPVVIYYVLRLMEEESNIKGRKEGAFFLAAMLISGMAGIYYAFFSCFLFCVAILYNLINKNSVDNVKKSFAAIGSIIIGVLLSATPSFVYWLQNGTNQQSVVRSAASTSDYGLRISRLLMPITGHRISALADLKETFNHSYKYNENDSAALGIVLSIGFVVLLLAFFSRNAKRLGTDMHKIMILNLCALLYASTGGIIEIQGIFFAGIRCGTRISVFVAFFASLCLGLILNRWREKENRFKEGRGRKIWTAIVIALLCIGLLDQTKASYVEADEKEEQIKNDREFIEKIEAMEKDGAMIFQLPNVEFPEAGKVKNMMDYSHFIGYLYSDTLRWSYGAMKGREGSVFLHNISSKELDEMVKNMAECGYAGIYIDRYGYNEAELEMLESGLKDILAEEPIVSEDGRYAYYTMKGYIDANMILTDRNAFKLNLLGFVPKEGLYREERDENGSWRWSQQQSALDIHNYNDEEIQVRLKLKIVSWTEEEYGLVLSGENIEDRLTVSSAGTDYTRIMTLKPGENLINFESDIPYLKSETDSRKMSFYLTDYAVESLKEIDIDFSEGFYDLERNVQDGTSWRWAEQRSVVRLSNYMEEEVEAEITANVIASQYGMVQEPKLSVVIDGEERQIPISQEITPISLKISLKPGENEILFLSNIPYLQVDNDSRNLCFMLTEFKMKTEKSGETHQK